MKVNFLDKNVRSKFWQFFSVISGGISFFLLFVKIPEKYEGLLPCVGIAVFGVLALIYFLIWFRGNKLRKITVDVDGSEVIIECGDIFEQADLKVITFNEYFDTLVDDKVISRSSLNGVFVNKFFQGRVDKLDDYINVNSQEEDIIHKNAVRKNGGKTIKYQLSTLIVYDDFVLTAFAKFDEQNRAVLSMPEYIEFLINFWDRINSVYAQRAVSVPIFGSGITRIKEHKNISDEELLRIMLWTFKLSEMKFRYPAKLTIVIHEDKINQINLFSLKSIERGL